MKQCYEVPSMCILELIQADIVRTSFETNEGGGYGGETGWDQG